MVELPIFISYRRDDGAKVAAWLRDSLQGRSIQVSDPVCYLATISAYFDQAAPAVPDWKTLQMEELQRARAFLLVCSPGVMHEFRPEDDLYQEIRWWLTNRPDVSPILVTWLDERWIPDIVSERWPNAQFIRIDFNLLQTPAHLDHGKEFERGIQSIISGICGSVSRRTAGDLTVAAEPSFGLNLPGLYYWEKDKFFRYTNCNENYARAAGYDSPRALIGKSDNDMPWAPLADSFRMGDQQIISGKGPPRNNVQETEIMVDRVADILVNEAPLLDRRKECIGVVGHFADITRIVGNPEITNPELIPEPVADGKEGKTFPLGPELEDGYLSEIEVEIIKGMLQLYSAEMIAALLAITRGAVEFHIRSIKRKLQCGTDGDVIVTAIKCGLHFRLFGIASLSRRS